MSDLHNNYWYHKKNIAYCFRTNAYAMKYKYIYNIIRLTDKVINYNATTINS